MITLRKSEERGHTKHGWLDSRHTFSFVDYYEPSQMGFRSLRVLNENWLEGGKGFDAHPYHVFEIVTHVVRGELAHVDPRGNMTLLSANSVHRISAGTGVEFSRYTNLAAEPVRFLQLWLHPARNGRAAISAQAFFSNAWEPLQLACSPDGRESSLWLNEDVDVFIGRLGPDAIVTHALRKGRSAWVQLIDGDLTLDGHKLAPGDGAALQNESDVPLESRQGAHFLLLDLC